MWVGHRQRPGQVVAGQLHAALQHQLDGLDRRHAEQRRASGDRRVDPRQRDQRRRPQPGAGDQAQPHLRDQGQRALAADQQSGQVVADVVLEQPAQPRHDGAGRQHSLQTDHLRAGRPEPHGRRAAGVGRRHPTDRGRVTCAEVHGHPQVVPADSRLHGRQRGARADSDLERQRLDLANLGQQHRGQHDLAAAWHAATDQPGVASLGDDGNTLSRQQLQHVARLLGQAGADDARGRPAEAPGPVQLVGGAQVLVDQNVLAADDVGQPLDRCGSRCGHRAAG